MRVMIALVFGALVTTPARAQCLSIEIGGSNGAVARIHRDSLYVALRGTDGSRTGWTVLPVADADSFTVRWPELTQPEITAHSATPRVVRWSGQWVAATQPDSTVLARRWSRDSAIASRIHGGFTTVAYLPCIRRRAL